MITILALLVGFHFSAHVGRMLFIIVLIVNLPLEETVQWFEILIGVESSIEV